ncbi:MAG: YdcF family protein [Candidatus Sedimenticola sp. 20ELBAFRAG]
MHQETIWFLKTLIIPPGGLVILGLIGLMMSRRFLGKLLLLITLAALYLLSTPFISRELIGYVETVPPLNMARLKDRAPQAIVVLGGSRHPGAPEYNRKDTIGSSLLERLRYAAWLSRQTGLPVIPSGGSGADEGEPEADMAKEVLEREFSGKVIAVENRSRTTWGNAHMTGELLDRLMIERVLLVTHAWHMPRAMEAFKQAGISVTPAPTGFQRRSKIETTMYDWLPRASSLELSSIAIHEQLGSLWYRFRHWLGI